VWLFVYINVLIYIGGYFTSTECLLQVCDA
jgi:hypothetical protein